MSTESIVILVAIIASIVIGGFSRIAGRALGVAIVAAILAWGAYRYSQGHTLAFFDFKLEPLWFYVIVGALLAWEIVALYLAVRARNAQPPPEA